MLFRSHQKLIAADLGLRQAAEAWAKREDPQENPRALDDLYDAAIEYTDAWRADQAWPEKD